MSRTLSINQGSGDSLNVSVRCGCNPKARQIRPMVAWLRPVALAMPRVLQWVLPRGVDSRVRTTTSSTCASVMRRGAPGRGSSVKPSSRSARNRVRHLQTVVGDRCRRLAIPRVGWPSAQARMMRARRASCGAVRDRWASEVKACRSSSVKVTAAGRGPLRMDYLLLAQTTTTPRTFHCFQWQDTRWVCVSTHPARQGRDGVALPRCSASADCSAWRSWTCGPRWPSRGRRTVAKFFPSVA